MSSPGEAYEAYRNGSWLLEVREYRQAASSPVPNSLASR